MDKVALVTGGARRIGGEIARYLHDAGFTLALHYRDSASQADAMAAELCSIRPESCHTFRADLENAADIRVMSRSILQRFGGLDLLVNNASSFNSTPIETCTEAQFDAVLGANLKGPYFLIQSLLDGLRKRGGNVINIVDIHLDRPPRHFNAYTATKAGLASLTRCLALELGPDIRVNGIAPGAILWPENGEEYDGETRRGIIEKTPLKRLGEPADIARTVLFLACHAPFIDGQIIAVDGGLNVAT